jgi:MFS transporter, ACS family, hexuronate transporter
MNPHLETLNPAPKKYNYRWTIVALLFAITSLNYIDRQIIALLKDDYLAPKFNWDETDYSNIVISFQIAYAIGLITTGWIIDKIGSKVGYLGAIGLWSMAAILHAAAGSTGGFIYARAFLGFSEAGNIPAAIKSVNEWFPKKERALATGIFNSGINMGAIFAPLSIPFIAQALGWKAAFIIIGILGFVWLIFWWIYYDQPRKQTRLTANELAYIEQEDLKHPTPLALGEKNISIRSLLNYKQTWAFAIAKFFTDPIWWFYLFWLPSFLKGEYLLNSKQSAIPLAVVYILAMVGSIGGGWLSSYFIKKGSKAFNARLRTLFIFSLFALPVILVQYFGGFNYWWAILIIGIAAAGHQGYSANIFTTVSDLFPKNMVAKVTGIGAMAGAIGSILFSFSVGRLLNYFEDIGRKEQGYFIIFAVCSGAYVLATVLIKNLTKNAAKINVEDFE